MSATSGSGLLDSLGTLGEVTAVVPAKEAGRSPLRLFVAVAWFALVTAGWFVLLWVVMAYPGGWEGLWIWARSLSLTTQILMWLLLLPYIIALWVWNTSWAEWLRVAVVATVVIGSITASIPWPRR